MGFKAGAFAKVWEVREGRGNYTDVRLSISRKKRDSNEYEQVFGGWCRFVGDAHMKACSMLTKDDRIKIIECDVTNNYDKEKNVTYYNFAVYDYEDADSADSSNNGNSNRSSSSDGYINTGSSSDEGGFINVPDDYDEPPFR